MELYASYSALINFSYAQNVAYTACMMRESIIKIKRRLNGLGYLKSWCGYLTFKIYNSLQMSLLLYVMALYFYLFSVTLFCVTTEKPP
jgi:hypothetical protein